MGLLDFFKRKEATEESKEPRLENLIKNNLNGLNRKQILGELKRQKLFIGTREKLPPVIDSDIVVNYLTTSSPAGVTGNSLIAFLTENGLANRNKEAYPVLVDLSVINTFINSSDLSGLIIIAESGWVFFPKSQLPKNK